MKRTHLSTRTVLLAVLVAMLVICLALTLTLSANMQAVAQEDVSDAPSEEESGTDGTVREVQDLDSFRQAISDSNDGDTIKLTQDISNISETIDFNRSDISLTFDLNGHTLKGDYTCTIITISAGTVTLIDSSSSSGGGGSEEEDDSETEEATGTGEITGGICGIYTMSRTKFVMKGGTILRNYGGYVSSNATRLGGGVLVGPYATFEMEGGTITTNSAGTYGGGVEIASYATFTMRGGAIRYNYSRNGGGICVYNYANFNLEGGTITRNSATYGGGVIAYGGSTVTMSGGTIDRNSASGYAGGIRIQGNTTFTMDGGEITNNSSAGTCGGVYVYGAASFVMNGGKISGNSAMTYVGGVYVYASNGNASFTMKGGEISNNTAGSLGGGIRVYTGVNGTPTMNISGNPVIKDNLANVANGAYESIASDLYLGNNSKKFTIVGELTEGAEIYVQSDYNSNAYAITNGASEYGGEDLLKYFHSDDANKCLRYYNNEVQLCKHELKYSSNYSTTDEHWAQCQYCGEQSANEAHTVTGNWTNATANHTAKCDLCQATVTQAHTLGEYQADAQGKHFKACTANGCDYETARDAHNLEAAKSTGDSEHQGLCTVCKLTVTENCKTSQQHDNSAHWQQCSVCNNRSEVTEHKWDTYGWTSNGSSGHTSKCGICNETKTADHFLEWQSDGNNHYQQCTAKGCNYATEHQAHTLQFAKSTGDSEHTGICSICKLTVTESHATTQRHNKLAHWDECSVCNVRLNETMHDFDDLGWEKQDNSTHQSTCETCKETVTAEHVLGSLMKDEKGYYQKCTANGCDYETERQDLDEKHVHAFNKQKSDENYHWYECECGSRNDVQKHDGGEWKKEGNNHYKQCDTCNAKYSNGEHVMKYHASGASKHYQQCEVCNHTTSAESHQVVYANYTDSNEHTGLCSICNLTVSEIHVQGILQHNQDSHWNKCTVCDGKVNEVTHEWSGVWQQAESYHYKRCEVCQEELHGEHSATNWADSHDGNTHRGQCVCGKELTEEHVLGSLMQDSVGYYQQCTATGCTYETERQDVGDTHIHTYTVQKYDENYHWDECPCGARRNVTQHNFGSAQWTATDNATHTATCVNCGKTVTEEHNFDLNKDDDGYWLKCNNCGFETEKSLYPNPTPSEPTPDEPTEPQPSLWERLMAFFENTPLPLGYAVITLGVMLLLIIILAIAARKPRVHKKGVRK